ncbi:acyltransferase [Mesorhizobium sp. L-8-10]|uniref:acyltransferase family protein n=1 Tax=Mesorhizobium sp. L-8-10 TaxID=2744523 RepID=UPI001926FE19|nr:acyltransferase [Mesorhizobium sp. L-8-10]BCH33041.1 acyltransferase [Mesorhizobium sp. L-8-10]
MIWSLQSLRFVAALMVVYAHAAQTALAATGSTGLLPLQLAAVGISGVDIFFVLSGVVIARTARGLTWRQFAWKRLRRIVPIYYLVCIPALFMAARVGFGWRDFIATFLLWPATDVMTTPMLPVAWTLCFEALFYSAAALVLADRRWVYVLVAMYAIALVLRPYGPLFQFLGNPIIVEFLLGVGIAFLPGRRLGLLGIPAGMVALLATGFSGTAPTGETVSFLAGEGAFPRLLAYGVPAALIVYGTMQIRAGESVWAYLGDGSYTLYLVHSLVITALSVLWLKFHLPADVIILVGMGASVLLAWRIHERIERPLLRILGQADAGWMVLTTWKRRHPGEGKYPGFE